MGSGPRHMAYHPTLPMVYFSNEQGVGLSTYHREPNGQLKIEQDISILPPGISKIGLSASDLLITPNGKFLFAGLRGHSQNFDHISRYRILENGMAEFLGLTKADKTPWGLTLSPDGKFLLVTATTEPVSVPIEFQNPENSRKWRRLPGIPKCQIWSLDKLRTISLNCFYITSTNALLFSKVDHARLHIYPIG